MDSKTIYAHILSYTFSIGSDLILLVVNLSSFPGVTSTLTVFTFVTNGISDILLCYVFLTVVRDFKTSQENDG